MSVLGWLTSFSIALEAQHDLWRAIPPRRDILRHVSGILLRIDAEAARETKVGDLEFAVGVDEQIARFEIAVQHVGAVDVLQTAQDLVDEGLEVGIRQRLAGADDGCEIALHEFCKPRISLCHSQDNAPRYVRLTLIQIRLVKAIRPRNIHIIQTRDIAMPTEML